MTIFQARTPLPVDRETAFAWHARPGALPRLLPPWEDIRVVQTAGNIENGARVVLGVKPPGSPVRVELVAEHDSYQPPELFRDRLVETPLDAIRLWEHVHRFDVDDDDPDRCVLTDRIEYELAFGPAGRWAEGAVMHDKLDAMFAYRHRITRDDLAFHQAVGSTPKTVLVTGASGLVGRTLCAMLSTGGHTVRKLTRSKPDEPGEFRWLPSDNQIDEGALDGVDAVIHLAGESIMGRWNETKKRRIRQSRVNSTRLLAERIAAMGSKPALVVASAIGWYGDRPGQVQTETDPAADDFLADVCREWEAAADPAREAGARVAHVRLGIVLSPEGGALANMLPAFKLAAGGPVGRGEQVWSWVARDDAAAMFAWAALSDHVSGAVNATAPNPVTSKQFATTLGRVLGRPAVLPAPALALRALFGEMADALLLASADVRPERTTELGYEFRFPELEDALRHLLGKATLPQAEGSRQGSRQGSRRG